MFTNLYRLRLLDFFELTAATGAAVYVYQTGGWHDFEGHWVIVVLAMAAIVFWIATRLGKTSPLPGLFVAVYAGALYGLSDLSPWMALVGRLELIDLLLQLFPIQETGSLLSPVIRPTWLIVLLITIITGIPALLAGSLLKSAAFVIEYCRGGTGPQSTKLSKFRNAVQIIFAMLVLTVLVYHWARPQIRYVKTIRVPFQYVKRGPTKRWGRYEVAPTISVWRISEPGNRLLVLRSDKSLLELDLFSGAVLSNVPLACGDFPLGPRHRLSPANENEPFEVTVELQPVDLFEPQCQLVRTAEGHILLWRDDIPTLYDSKTGLEVFDRRLNVLKNSKLKAISGSGVFALLGDEPAQETPTVAFGVWNLQTLTKIRRETFSRRAFEFQDVLINNDGYKIRFCPIQFEILCKRRFDWRFREVIGDCQSYSEPQVSDDGEITLSGMMLTPNSGDSRGLYSFNERRMHAKLAPRGDAIVLIAEPATLPDTQWEGVFKDLFDDDRIPILETLLERAHCGQLTLFNPKTNQSNTTFLRQGLLKRPAPASAKFSSDGRYLFIQDEDESADLFHVFAMP